MAVMSEGVLWILICGRMSGGWFTVWTQCLSQIIQGSNHVRLFELVGVLELDGGLVGCARVVQQPGVAVC